MGERKEEGMRLVETEQKRSEENLVDARGLERSDGGRGGGADEKRSNGEGLKGHESGIADKSSPERSDTPTELRCTGRSPPPVGVATTVASSVLLHLSFSAFALLSSPFSRRRRRQYRTRLGGRPSLVGLGLNVSMLGLHSSWA